MGVIYGVEPEDLRGEIGAKDVLSDYKVVASFEYPRVQRADYPMQDVPRARFRVGRKKPFDCEPLFYPIVFKDVAGVRIIGQEQVEVDAKGFHGLAHLRDVNRTGAP